MAYKKTKRLPKGDWGRARSVTATHQTLPGFQSVVQIHVFLSLEHRAKNQRSQVRIPALSLPQS